MERIPMEIVKQIVQEIGFPKGGHIPEYGTRESTLTYPNADLKAVRLCSKALAEAAKPLLFSALHLFMDATSFAKMLAIAENPELSCSVRHVVVFPSQVQDLALSRQDYETALEGLFGQYGSVYRRYQHYSHDGWSPSPIFSEAQIDQGYLQYRAFFEEYQKLKPNISNLLARAFTSFDRLQAVTLGFYYDQEQYDKGEELPNLPPAVLNLHTKTLLPFYGDAPIHLDLNRDMEVLRAASLCRSKIDCLNLFTRSRALNFGMLQLSEEDFTIVRELLASVSSLAFEIPTSRGMKVLYKNPEDQPFQLLRSAVNLKDLTLRGFQQTVNSKDFGYTLRKAHFPSLRSLRLETTYFEGRDLITLVQDHKTTLEKLELSRVNVLSQSWYEVFTAIRGAPKELNGMFPKLRRTTQ